MRVSEYTDKIDILSYGNKAKRIHAQVRVLSLLSPLLALSLWPPSSPRRGVACFSRVPLYRRVRSESFADRSAPAQIREICAIMSGLVVASDYSIGQQLVKDHDFKHNAQFFQAMFEVRFGAGAVRPSVAVPLTLGRRPRSGGATRSWRPRRCAPSTAS